MILNFYSKQNLTNEDFNRFSKLNNIDDELLNNTLFEVFNNIRNFHQGGKFEIFKYREADWGLPSNILNREDIMVNGDLSELSDSFEIYRGMSLEEFQNSDYGQSWTTDYDTARKFAEETYSDKPKGVVAKAMLTKKLVLHYEKSKEFEVIIIKGGIKKSDVSISS
ncbi:hypothetical protein ACSJMR_13265 [Acinetobacter pecorum]|uniref:hypothetical protein n=1 Tax=Acinetobacter pecorum TaxID=2762215 RepID=UPI003EE6F635